MDFESVISNRFSARSFKSEKVSEDKILKILEAGRIAPTAKNMQPQKIYVVTSEEGLEKIDKISPCRYNAPVCLLVCADKNNSFSKGNYSTYEMDATIVTTHMMLEATNIGVDNIWIEMFDANLASEEFNLPKNIVPVCILDLGYRTEECHPSHLHGTRKELKELVEFI